MLCFDRIKQRIKAASNSSDAYTDAIDKHIGVLRNAWFGWKGEDEEQSIPEMLNNYRRKINSYMSHITGDAVRDAMGNASFAVNCDTAPSITLDAFGPPDKPLLVEVLNSMAKIKGGMLQTNGDLVVTCDTLKATIAYSISVLRQQMNMVGGRRTNARGKRGGDGGDFMMYKDSCPLFYQVAIGNEVYTIKRRIDDFFASNGTRIGNIADLVKAIASKSPTPVTVSYTISGGAIETVEAFVTSEQADIQQTQFIVGHP